MRRSLASFLVLACVALAGRAAEPKDVALRVEGMNCALCPITIRKALERMPGVLEARVEYRDKRAHVKYDPDKARPEALAKAVTEAGYPAKVER